MKLQSGGYYVNNHSCFLLQYHLVLITKYRHPVISGNIEETLFDYTRTFFSSYDLFIVEINGDKDHIHILFEAYPQINLAEFINTYKSSSSRYIRSRYFEYLKPYYWKPYFWSSSYFISTVSDRSAECVRKYISNQKK